MPRREGPSLLDQHLAGVEVVKKGLLSQAFADWLKKLPGVQLRFRRGSPTNLPQITEWSVEQALRYGTALPQVLRGRAVADMVDRIRPEWVSPPALACLETIGLGEKNVERIVGWILEGQVPLPSNQPTSGIGKPLVNGKSSLVDAAAEILRPSQPRDAADLAALAERLYRSHETMFRIAGPRWLDRLDALARAPLVPLASLPDAINGSDGQQYLLVDCLGLPLLSHFQQGFSAMLPDWRLVELTFAQVESKSTTDACNRLLIEAGFREKLEKINRVDALVHGQFLPFEDFARLAMAELAIACRSVRSRLIQPRR